MSFSSGLQLRVINGQKEKDRIIRLDGKELTLGRAQKGQRPGYGEILFREPTVSRVHASLTWKDRKNSFQLTHKSSTNPTLVNGKSTKKALLAPGDRVQMGLLVLVIEQIPAHLAQASIGSSIERARSPMAEPILEALSKVERQEEEDRRRAKAENEQKQRQREHMALANPSSAENPTLSTRSKRLDEALRSSPVQPRQEQQQRRISSGFGWQPPEERAASYAPLEISKELPLETEQKLPYKGQSPSAQASSEVESPSGPAQASTARRRDAVFELVVVKGPDQGRRFPLKDMVMILGQRQSDKDEREEQGILLNDPTLPVELGMFAWQGREDSYGLLASENSMQIIEVDRISDGVRRRIRVDSVSSLLLRVADEIQIGLTTLRMQKIGEPIATRSARLAPGPDSSTSLYQRSEQPSPKSSPSYGATLGDHLQPPRQPEALEQEEPKKRAASQPIEAAKPGHKETASSTPLWAQATLTPGRDAPPAPGSQPPVGTVGRSAPARSSPATPTSSEEDTLEWGNRPKADFLFEFTAGPMRGCQVSINRDDIARAHRYHAGVAGERENDLLLEGANINNSAFQLIGEDGRFSLYCESASGLIAINRSPIKQGDRLVLVTGDTITIDDTQIRFLERDVVSALSQYALLADSGVTSDQDRIFGFKRQRLLIGRGKHCDIRLSDLEVSRIHLGLAYGEGRFSIQHRSETNPTFLNGLSLIPGAVRTLKVGDRVRLSSLTVLRFIKR